MQAIITIHHCINAATTSFQTNNFAFHYSVKLRPKFVFALYLKSMYLLLCDLLNNNKNILYNNCSIFFLFKNVELGFFLSLTAYDGKKT